MLGRGKVLAVSVLSIRHLLLPLVAWALVRLMRLEPMQASVLMTFSAVPTASSAYVLAARMGYNGAFVAGLVTMSTLLGVASLTFALALPR
jgi:malonate transporter